MEDPTVYSEQEITKVLSMVRDGNVNLGGLTKCVTACGVVGNFSICIAFVQK